MNMLKQSLHAQMNTDSSSSLQLILSQFRFALLYIWPSYLLLKSGATVLTPTGVTGLSTVTEASEICLPTDLHLQQISVYQQLYCYLNLLYDT